MNFLRPVTKCPRHAIRFANSAPLSRCCIFARSHAMLYIRRPTPTWVCLSNMVGRSRSVRVSEVRLTADMGICVGINIHALKDELDGREATREARALLDWTWNAAWDVETAGVHARARPRPANEAGISRGGGGGESQVGSPFCVCGLPSFPPRLCAYLCSVHRERTNPANTAVKEDFVQTPRAAVVKY